MVNNLNLIIKYSDSIAVNDFTKILGLFRKSVVDYFKEYGISSKKINKVIRIQCIKEGSIDVNLVLNVIGMSVGVLGLIITIVGSMQKKLKLKKYERLIKEILHDENKITIILKNDENDDLIDLNKRNLKKK